MEIPMCECKRCGHRWLIRVREPKTCPKCKSPYWNKERQRVFKERVQDGRAERFSSSARESSESVREIEVVPNEDWGA